MQCSVGLAGCITLKGGKVEFAMCTRVVLPSHSIKSSLFRGRGMPIV